MGVRCRAAGDKRALFKAEEGTMLVSPQHHLRRLVPSLLAAVALAIPPGARQHTALRFP